MVLDRIKKVNDIKQLNEEELEELQEEIRDFFGGKYCKNRRTSGIESGCD